MKLFGYTILAASAALSAHGADIVDTAVGAAPTYDVLVAAVTAAGLVDTLKSPGPFTVFAPTNPAFVALGFGDAAENTPIAHLLNDNSYSKTLLTEVLTTHVLDSQVVAADLPASNVDVASVSGENLRFDASIPQVQTTINSATITNTDIGADNGVIHEINTVLLPASFEPKTIATKASETGLNILVEALVEAGLESAFDNAGDNAWTVFAPTDAAFAAALTKLGLTKEQLFADQTTLATILSAHVVKTDCDSACVTGAPYVTTSAGEEIAVATVIPTLVDGSIDIRLLNGYVHVVDTVIVPPSLQQNIVEIAQAEPAAAELVKAVVAAGLVDTLSGPGPFTVFAPVNAAFEALGANNAAVNTPYAHLVAGSSYSTKLLQEVITTHAIAAEVFASGLPQPGVDVASVSTENLQFDATVPKVQTTVNEATIVGTDVDAKNGVVHVIDTVLLPASFEAKTIATKATEAGLTVLVEALVAAGLGSTFDNAAANAWTVFAPSDAAFVATLNALGLTKEELFADTELLTTVLQAHVINTDCDSSCVTANSEFTTLGGEKIQLSAIADTLVTTDIRLLNGYVHLVDAVIIPPSLGGATAPPAPAPVEEEDESNVGTYIGLAGGLIGACVLVAVISAQCAKKEQQEQHQQKAMVMAEP